MRCSYPPHPLFWPGGIREGWVGSETLPPPNVTSPTFFAPKCYYQREGIEVHTSIMAIHESWKNKINFHSTLLSNACRWISIPWWNVHKYRSQNNYPIFSTYSKGCHVVNKSFKISFKKSIITHIRWLYCEEYIHTHISIYAYVCKTDDCNY